MIGAILRWLASLFRRTPKLPQRPPAEQRPSPHFSSRQGATPRMLVLHGDAGATDEGTIGWIQDPASKVSYHYFIGRDGRLYQFVQEEDKAWHAGVSEWPGLTVGNSVNPTSIGICFANDGTGNEPYEPYQLETGAQLTKYLLAKYSIDREDITGHFEVSPGRKTDPWGHFPWEHFHRMLNG